MHGQVSRFPFRTLHWKPPVFQIFPKPVKKYIYLMGQMRSRNGRSQPSFYHPKMHSLLNLNGNTITSLHSLSEADSTFKEDHQPWNFSISKYRSCLVQGTGKHGLLNKSGFLARVKKTSWLAEWQSGIEKMAIRQTALRSILGGSTRYFCFLQAIL